MIKLQRRHWVWRPILVLVSTELFAQVLFHSYLFKTRSEEPLCTMEQVKQGEWTPITFEKAPYDNHNTWYKAEQNLKNDWNTWEWQPKTQCHFVAWDKEKFCQAARNKTILFIGDSLTAEHFFDLMYRFDLYTDEKKYLTAWSEPTPYGIVLCNGAVRVFMQGTPYLYWWVDESINQTSPDIIVFNRGAHIAPDQESKDQMRLTTKSLLKWQRGCRDKSDAGVGDCHLIWRTTVPGHPRCWEFTKPSKSIEEMEALVATTESSVYNDSVVHWGAYDWASFKRQNKMFVSLLQLSGLDFDVMPAYEINILRPDNHVLLPPNTTADKIDCLHSRYPGKMGVYNQLLLHLILVRQERQALSEIIF